LTWDEASLGYNAWSIALTGRDEHAKFLPYDAFAAFGDYKPRRRPFSTFWDPPPWRCAFPRPWRGSPPS
jgi:hypothetical protein